MLLKDKNAVVTGCNRGIGKAILEAFASNGASIWAVVRTESDDFDATCADLAKTHGVRIRPVTCDLSDMEQVKAASKTILADKIPVDVLVNNAGVITTSSFLMTPIDKFREMMDVNFMAPMALSQSITRSMLRQRTGSVVNISSSAAIEGNEGRSAYAAAKAALNTATLVMSRELGQAGIRVNAIAPGLTQTDMMTGSTADDALEATLARTSLGRVAAPAEIAQAVLFLASDMSSYMTGQVISVDGGM